MLKPAYSHAKGNLGANIEVVLEKYPLSYSIEDSIIKNIRLKIKLKVVQQHNFAENELFEIYLMLLNDNNEPVNDFKAAELDKYYTNMVKRALEKGRKSTLYITFKIETVSDIKHFPESLKKFSIRAQSDSIAY